MRTESALKLVEGSSRTSGRSALRPRAQSFLVSSVRYADAYRFSFFPSPTKAGFGLGALNEAEDDDVDVYDSTTHADRTYMPYDAIRDADDGSSVSRGKLVQKVVSFLIPSF
jgi:hypothetical protein